MECKSCIYTNSNTHTHTGTEIGTGRQIVTSEATRHQVWKNTDSTTFYLDKMLKH